MTILNIILIIILILFLWKIRPLLKVPKVSACALVTGAIKGGKSSFAFVLTYKTYKKNLRKWRIQSFFRKMFGKSLAEKPLFYSNIPLDTDYVLLEQDVIERKKRMRFKSCTFIDECSLLADSQLYKDKVVNEELMLFTKLYGHSTHGGTMIINTQSYDDLHYSMSRCVSQVFYVHHTTTWLPFFAIAWVREFVVDTNESTCNVITDDVETSLRPFVYSKRFWKKYDCYAFSDFTDDKEVSCDVRRDKDLKVHKIVSFRDFITLKNGDKKNVQNKN